MKTYLKNQNWLKTIIFLLPEIKKMFLIACGFVIIIEIFKIVPPYCIKHVIDLLLLENTNFQEVVIALLVILVVSVITTFIEDKYTEISAKNIFYTETELLKKSQKKLLGLDLSYHENNPSGDNIQVITKGAQRLADLSWFTYDQFLGASFQILITVVILIYLDWRVGLVFTFFLPITLYSIYNSSKKLQPYRKKYHGKFREANWVMNQSLINIKTVKDFVSENIEHKKYRKLLNSYNKLAILRMKKESKGVIVRDLLLLSSRVALLSTSAYFVYNKSMSAGAFYLFATLSEKCISSMFRLGRLYNFLGDAMESIQQFSNLFSIENEVKNTKNAIENVNIEGKIEFKAVNFEYLNKSEVIQNLSAKIEAKSIVALVGHSGAGKSTFIKLLLRHYDVISGEILLDDINIKYLDLHYLRQQIAIVSQDIEIFDMSVAENISYGEKVSSVEIEKVAKIANAHEFICKLNEGYNTKVGERGLKLSGGQKQRIGIARALLRKPKILIFDEATSSLDSESERLIQNALAKIARKQTIIIIAHRLSTVENADKILVLESGKLVEQGTNQELVKKNGVFAYMKKLQKFK